ncbi:probable leucine--tRNA ligase, mitochondrial [Uloborus diversus]|uniref:probable leucine--tRNA ligase, mitochondrial n=1 Tax=Uloborus diversus TaxID=327109 RepID=UPI0024095B4B|nr:probable leucine--tRNA ligase, mitochondrial [Uloborus diversus]
MNLFNKAKGIRFDISLLYSHCFNFRRWVFSVNNLWYEELTNEAKKEIEVYWKDKINATYPVYKNAEKFYLLSMFPYPSGKLHMGHVRVYTISDALARFFRMNGKRVIHPIGWDAFGLPAENAAIEKSVHPFDWTSNNINVMKNQLKDLNISFDWDMELSTCDPSYYKWTQYLFILLFEQGLAYKKQALVNWDPIDQTVLADEQVDENGFSWRSGCKVEKQRLSQWFLRTTAFSKDLFDGLNDPKLVEWRDATKIQKHWIGEPDGFIYQLSLYHKGQRLNDTLTVWTDSPELLYGATFVAISPNNHFNNPEYDGGSESHSLDLSVEHPLTGVPLPVFVTDELDCSSATDSCFGISSNGDEKILKFASKHGISIVPVLDPSNCLINSEEFSGMQRENAREGILNKAKKNGVVIYPASKKLRDWLISRQRYWGTPLPIINCPRCKSVAVPKEDLPVLLPKLEDFSGKGFSLKAALDWANVSCPKCGGPAFRELDTMDTFVDSSWYFLRFLDVKNESEPFSFEKISSDMPVDLYIGGKEHAGLHMFYARFMCHFLHSIKKIHYPEPFLQLLMQGMVLGKSYRIKGSGKYIAKDEVDFSESSPVEKGSGLQVIEEWEKMSKSKHNGIDPQEVINEYGIDTTRLFVLGSVAPQSPRKWNEELFPGIKNWQWRIWLTLADFMQLRNDVDSKVNLSAEDIEKHAVQLKSARNFYIKGVTHNYMNTRQLSVAISKLQGLTGDLRRVPKMMALEDCFQETLATLIIMLAPLAPHFSSELWSGFCSVANNSSSAYDLNLPVLHQKWPELDHDCEMEIHIKLNGEECDAIALSRPEFLKMSEEKAIELALRQRKVIDILNGSKVRHARYKVWPKYDSEVNIVYTPIGKKTKHKAKTAYS